MNSCCSHKFASQLNFYKQNSCNTRSNIDPAYCLQGNSIDMENITEKVLGSILLLLA